MKNHVKIYAKEELDMYFYRILKVWKDMEHRIRENEFESIDEKIKKDGGGLMRRKRYLEKFEWIEKCCGASLQPLRFKKS